MDQAVTRGEACRLIAALRAYNPNVPIGLDEGQVRTLFAR
jgi:hypothetical protein